jgi:hypothetical protein
MVSNRQQAAAEQACQHPPMEGGSQQNTEQPLLVGLDGGWVCSRDQRGGMEGKVAVVCSQMEDLPRPTVSTMVSWSERGTLRPPPRQRHRLAQRRYVPTFASSGQLGILAKAAAQELSQDQWWWWQTEPIGSATQQGRHFPSATCILDWAHLWREISHAIGGVARAKPLSHPERDYQALLHRSWLWQGGVEQAVRGLHTLATGLPAEAEEVVNKAITYLENQRPWIGSSEQWPRRGYPVGSGMIERAVALLINRRMKKRGMRWKRTNATAVVALRADLLNDDWVTPQRLRAFP